MYNFSPFPFSSARSSSSSSIDLGAASTEVISSTTLGASSVEAVLDLYILKRKTDFYDQIMVAWNDARIVRLARSEGVLLMLALDLCYCNECIVVSRLGLFIDKAKSTSEVLFCFIFLLSCIQCTERIKL